MLGAVDHPVAALPRGVAFHAAHVRSRLGFGHRQRVHPLAAHGGQQVAIALLALAGHQDVLRATEEMRQRHRPAAQFALDQREIQMAQPRAADLFGEVAGVKAQFQRLALDLGGDVGGHLAGAFDRRFVRIDLGFDESCAPSRRSSPVPGSVQTAIRCPFRSRAPQWHPRPGLSGYSGSNATLVSLTSPFPPDRRIRAHWRCARRRRDDQSRRAGAGRCCLSTRAAPGHGLSAA